MKKLSFSPRSVPAALLVFSIIAFGLLIPFLGFYWDDWQMIWFNYSTGPTGLFQAFQGDRPFLAIIFYLTSLIARPIPLDWQIFGLLTRFGLGLSFWWTIRKVWPKASEQLAWAAILFVIYPGFKQQPISVIYTNGYILQALFILSLGWMVCAMNNPKRFWLYFGLSLLSFAFCHSSEEYYIGLELIRPVIIFIILARTIQGFKPRVMAAIKVWAPYLVIMAAYLFWRVFIFGFPTYGPALIEQSQKSYLSRFIYLGYRIFKDTYDSTWLAWVQTFRFPDFNEFSIPTNMYFWIVAVGGMILAFFYLSKIKFHQTPSQPQENYNLTMELIIVGAAGLLAAGWPFWITNLPIELTYQYDRFTLPFMLGSALFLAGLIDWVLRLRYQKIVLLSVLIGFVLGSQLLNENTYRRDWDTMNDMFWQLVWRAPQIKPNTTVMTNVVPMVYYTDNSLTGPLNLIYAPDNHSLELPYYFMFTVVRVGQDHNGQDRKIPALIPGITFDQDYRSAVFHGSTDNALVLYYSQPHCLRILDPKHDTDLTILPNELEDAMAISNTNQIIPNPDKPATLSQPLFTAEPPHEWCYYFEKAELARQQNQWQEVVKLGDQAFSKGYKPYDSTELLPFIEGYAYTKQWDKALQMAVDGNDAMPKLNGKICDTLIQLKHNVPLDPGLLDEYNSQAGKVHCDLNK